MPARSDRRLDPDELLRRVQAEERQRERRGRLKVFLGYAPRVGKSLRMFDEGRRRKERGQDVVVAAVQEKAATPSARSSAVWRTFPPSAAPSTCPPSSAAVRPSA